MNIAHIVDLRVIGGIERMAVELIRATPQVRHTLVVFDNKLHPSLQDALAGLPQVLAIHSAKHWHGLRLPKSLRAGRRRHIICRSGADVVLNWSQILDVRGIDLPIVFYEHGSAWERYSSERLQQCYQGIHHAIAVSQAAKRMLQLHHGVDQPVTVIENTLLKQPKLAAQARHFPTGRFILGAAGRLVVRKNFVVLIEAVAVLRSQGHDVGLHIAGTGDDADKLQQYILHLGLQESVHLLGLVNDMDAFYRQCDAFVCSSIWESYGLVAIEAFAAGLPVIGANIDGLPEVVSHGVNGLCIEPRWDAAAFTAAMHEPASFAQDVSYQTSSDRLVAQKSLSPQDLAQSIADLLREPERYRRMSIAALQDASEIKSYQQLADEVVNSLKEACI